MAEYYVYSDAAETKWGYRCAAITEDGYTIVRTTNSVGTTPEAELWGVMLAAELAVQHAPADATIILCTDAQWISLNYYNRSKPHLSKKAWVLREKILAEREAEVQWIPGSSNPADWLSRSKTVVLGESIQKPPGQPKVSQNRSTLRFLWIARQYPVNTDYFQK